MCNSLLALKDGKSGFDNWFKGQNFILTVAAICGKFSSMQHMAKVKRYCEVLKKNKQTHRICCIKFRGSKLEPETLNYPSR